MSKKSIDLNADIGEGMPFDEELMQYISSCNIACGGHYGDKDSIMKTLFSASLCGLNIGAHPSYPDKLNFGRESIDISNENLLESIDNQLQIFEKCVKKAKAKWTHIKFHGALYNDLKTDVQKAEAIVHYLKSKHPEKNAFCTTSVRDFIQSP